MIFDHGGSVIASDQKEHTQIYPRPGWVEHNPEEIWLRTQEVVSGVLEKSQLRRDQIAAIGITNQRETTLVWDRRSGKPIYDAIVWQDTRTDEIINTLSREGGQDRFRSKTGLPLATYFSGPKIRWILDNVPGAREAARAGELLFGNIDSYLIWQLTRGPGSGRHVTDVTNASRTLLMDLRSLDRDDGLLDAIGVPREMLPEIRSSSEMYGNVCSGPLAGLPIAGVLGDQQAATVGQVCFDVGEAKNTYGTGNFS
jgi:glycerol kinase